MRFQLQKYNGRKTRHKCPACQKAFEFTLYVDDQNNPLHHSVGRCNREIKCGYHKTPKQHFTEHPQINFQSAFIKRKTLPKNEKIDFIIPKYVEESLNLNHTNNFIEFLRNNFQPSLINPILFKYQIGTSTRFQGAPIFWQIDILGKIRTGKIIEYNDQGKREGKIRWVHNYINPQENFNLQQCFFGEHLIRKSKNKTVGIVESEKTCLITSAYYPELTWIATGGLSNFKSKDLSVLNGKKVILFPDDGAFEKWNEFKRCLEHKSDVRISDLIESEQPTGKDLADYLLEDLQ